MRTIDDNLGHHRDLVKNQRTVFDDELEERQRIFEDEIIKRINVRSFIKLKTFEKKGKVGFNTKKRKRRYQPDEDFNSDEMYDDDSEEDNDKDDQDDQDDQDDYDEEEQY